MILVFQAMSDVMLLGRTELTHSGDKFLYYDSCKPNSQIVVFATTRDLFSMSDICHCDTTFLMLGDKFFQLHFQHVGVE